MRLPKAMIKRSLYISFLLLSSYVFAQLDDAKKGNSDVKIIHRIDASAKKSKPNSLDFNDFSGFKTANKTLEKKKLKDENERAIENKGIITPEIMAEYNYKKNVEGKYKNFPLIDMDLGSFHTKSESIFINSFDFGRFDGDRVQMKVNGKIVQENYLLTPRIKTVEIPLAIGINRVEVIALNEGDFSPNTGYFAFFDDTATIKKGEWMLAKGAKVIAIVVRNEK